MLNFRCWLESEEGKPKILWVTGMNSRGLGPQKLKAMGYPIVHVPTITSWPTAIAGFLKRYPAFSSIKKTANKWAAGHVDRNVQQFNNLAGDFEPDIVVGTSQGGAIAMSIAHQFPRAKFVLGAPAWKIFNVVTFNLPKDTIIVHGKGDTKVPLADSEELAKKTGARLVVTNDSHHLPFESIYQAILMQQQLVSA